MRLSEKLSYPIENTPFYNRPLCFFCAVFLCSLFLIQMSAMLFGIFVALIAVFAFVLAMRDKKMRPFCNPVPYLMLAAILLSVILPTVNILNYNKLSSLSGERTVKALVLDEYYEEQFGSLYRVELIEIDGERVLGNAVASFTFDPMLSVYDTVTVVAELSDARAGMSFFEQLSAKSANVCLLLDTKEFVSVTNEGRSGIRYEIYRLRNGIGARLDEVLSPKTAAYAKALLIGDKDGLGVTFRADMSALGISHILAVSGMHMSIIAMLMTFVANRFKTSRKLKSAIMIVGGLVFTAIAGFSPSVVRAAVMMTVGLLAVFFGGKSDSLTSLMLSGVIICAAEPLNVISCSFLLSFFATLGIVLCALYAESASRRRMYSSRVGDMRLSYALARKIAFSLLVTLCATLFTAPVLSLYFSEISYFSFVMNPVAIPMAFVSMLLTLFSLFFGKTAFAGAFICDIFDFIYLKFESFVHFVARNFTTTASLLHPFFKLCLIILLCSLVFMWIARVRNPLAVIAAFSVVALIYAGSLQAYTLVTDGRTELTYISSETSEGLLLNSGSDTVYIDIGNGGKSVPVLALEVAETDYYETGLDGFMLTHYHSDHIGTFKRLLREQRIKTLYLPVPENEKERIFCRELEKHAEYTEIVKYKRGEPLQLGQATVLTLPYTLIERSEHPVIAIKVSFGAKSVTYLGSSVSESEANAVAEKFISDTSAIILGRHGPVTKESDTYLSFNKETEIYLSPFEDTDEAKAFPSGSYTYLSPNNEGIAKARFRLAP